MISNIKNNTISEADTKKKIDKLNETKKLETKCKRLIKNQEKLLILFDDLVEAISNNNNSNNSNSSNINNNNKSDSVIVNKDKNKNESENEGGNVSENENHDVQYYEIKQINNIFKKIDETKPFEDKIDILKKVPESNDYWYTEYCEDNKETNLRLFKLKLAHFFNDDDDNLFKEIFGFTSVELADKLINTTSKEENQMLINDIEMNRDKIFEQDEYSKFVIQQTHKRDDLLDTVKFILQFNKTIQPYLT